MKKFRVLSWAFGALGLLIPALYLGQEVRYHAGTSAVQEHRCGLSAMAAMLWLGILSGALSTLAVAFGTYAAFGQRGIPAGRVIELAVIGAPAIGAAILLVWFIALVAGV